jgi:hypothetical protein
MIKNIYIEDLLQKGSKLIWNKEVVKTHSDQAVEIFYWSILFLTGKKEVIKRYFIHYLAWCFHGISNMFQILQGSIVSHK